MFLGEIQVNFSRKISKFRNFMLAFLRMVQKRVQQPSGLIRHVFEMMVRLWLGSRVRILARDGEQNIHHIVCILTRY